VRAHVADVLLIIAVLLVLGSSIGILVMPDAYAKLHYVTPAALVAPLFVGLAVLVRSGWSMNSAQAWLAVAFMVASGPFLAHATIRAARIRYEGDWRTGTLASRSRAAAGHQEREPR
jgi:multicomponent Na+:H+ antiporter subunit G